MYSQITRGHHIAAAGLWLGVYHMNFAWDWAYQQDCLIASPTTYLS
jgi:hypothetical protein